MPDAAGAAQLAADDAVPPPRPQGNLLRDTAVGADISGPLGTTITADHNLVGLPLVFMPNDTIHFNDPLLGPLQDNGGPTWTRMPAAGSVAIDHGNDSGWTTDQRRYGHARVIGPAADIGAVEARSDVIFANGFD